METMTTKQREYTHEQRREAVLFWRENKDTMRMREVAAKFSIPVGTLSSWASTMKFRAGAADDGRKARTLRYPEETRQTAAEMLQNKLGSAVEIAKALNVKSAQSVVNWHKEYFGGSEWADKLAKGRADYEAKKRTEQAGATTRTYTEADVQRIRSRYEAQVKDSLTKAEEALAEAARLKARMERLTKISNLMAKKLGWTPEMVEVIGEVVAA